MKTYSLGQLYRAVPVEKRERGMYLPPGGRSMGIRIAATKGTGKTRLAGRVILWGDFLQGVAQVAIDPVGGLCDEFLDKFRLLSPREQRVLSARVRYIDMAGRVGTDGRKRVTPFPLYQIEGDESLYAVAQRYIDIIGRVDPSLSNAPMLGMNALRPLASDVGAVLAAIGGQITEAPALLRDPRLYREQIEEAVRRYPEIDTAANYLLDEYPALSPRDKQMLASSLLSKLHVFGRDPVQRAIYGASRGIDWRAVVDGKLTVLLDFSRIQGREAIQFAILVVYFSLMRFIQRRGPSKSHPPVGLVIDEITFLLGSPESQTELGEDLVHLIDRVSRSHNVWLTLIHQELNQISPRIEMTLRRCGTQILGSTSDQDAALAVARRFYPYTPHRVKKGDAVYSSYEGASYVIDERQTYYSIQEQQELNSRRVIELEPFHFLIGISPRDGKLPTTLTEFSAEDIDRGIYTDPAFGADAKRKLLQRDGRRMDEVLAEIDSRIPRQAVPMDERRDGPAQPYRPRIPKSN